MLAVLRRPGFRAVPALLSARGAAAFAAVDVDAPSRGVAALAMRGGAGVVGAVAAYVLYQVAARAEWNQRRRIRATILTPQPDLAVFHPGPLFLARPEKHAFITDLFNSDPAGPIVVTGPQGSGKTMVLKRALAGRAESVYVDLRATPAPSGDALSATLVEKAGYLFPPNELLGRAIFTRDAVSSANISLELDRAFRLITNVLREKKAANWVARLRGERPRIVPPLLCVDELNFGGDGAALLDDPTFWRFIDHVLFLTDNRLAHVVLGTSLDVAATLDAYPGWRARRQKVHIDYPRPATVAHYLEHTVNPFLVRVLNATPRAAAAAPPLPTVSPTVAHAAVELHEASASALPAEAHALTEPALAPAPALHGAARLRAGLRSLFFGSDLKPDAAETMAAVAPLAVSVPAPTAGLLAVSAEPARVAASSSVSTTAPEAPAPPARTSEDVAPRAAAVLGEGPTILVASARAAAPDDTASYRADSAAVRATASVSLTGAPVREGKSPADIEFEIAAAGGRAGTATGEGETIAGTGADERDGREASRGAGLRADGSSGASGSGGDAARLDAKAVRPRRGVTLHTLAANEIHTIVETVGGHLKDLDTVVTSVARGKHFLAALDLLVADSAEHVERVLETLLSAAEGGAGDGSGGGGGALSSSTSSAGSASSPTRSSSRVASVRARLLPLAVPPAFRWGAPFPRPAWNYLVAPKGDRLGAYARYTRLWDMLEAVAHRKFVPRRELALHVFVGCPHELELYADAGIIASMSVRAASRANGSLSSDTAADAHTDFELPGALVCAASPRLRAAFRALVSDERLRSQTEAVRGALRLARARDTEADLARRLPEVVAERAYWASMVSALLARDTALRGSVAKELMLLQSAAPVTGADFLASGSLSPQSAAHLAAGVHAPLAAGVHAPHAAGADAPQPSTLLGAFGLNDALATAMRNLKAAEAALDTLRGALAAARADIVAGEAAADAILFGTRDASAGVLSPACAMASAVANAATTASTASPEAADPRIALPLSTTDESQDQGGAESERFDLLDGNESESDDDADVDADGAVRDRDPRVFSTSFWLPSIEVARGRRPLGAPPMAQGAFRTSFFLPAPDDDAAKRKGSRRARREERANEQGKTQRFRWWL
jgi:hypothetical protein